MAGRSKGGSTPFAWTTVFYLLLVFIAPLALLQPARAQDEQAPMKDDLGTGMLPDDCVEQRLLTRKPNQSLALILARRTRKLTSSTRSCLVLNIC